MVAVSISSVNNHYTTNVFICFDITFSKIRILFKRYSLPPAMKSYIYIYIYISPEMKKEPSCSVLFRLRKFCLFYVIIFPMTSVGHVKTRLTCKMESVTRVQILEEAVCVSLCATPLGKGMNLSLLPTPLNEEMLCEEKFNLFVHVCVYIRECLRKS